MSDIDLKPYADRDTSRPVDEPFDPNDRRSHFEHDRARILHSAAFRRMQGKAQVFYSSTGSDFVRNRLTHSLEAAQIGKGLALRVGVHPELVETACLAHDIGNPPFGHSAERQLNKCMEKGGDSRVTARPCVS